MASLFVIQGRDQGKRFELDDVSSVGRDTSNSIQLHDTEVSRRHAEIRGDQGTYTLVDLNSSNGSFANNSRIERHPLCSGDRIQLGRTLLIFTGDEDRQSSDVLEDIDIVARDAGVAESRIIKSIRQEQGQQILTEEEADEHPWLARTRSNLDVMYHTALAASHTLDIHQLLQRIMELVFEWVEADRGCIMLVDDESQELVPAVRRNRQGVKVDQRMVISRTILDYVLQHTEGVMTSDASDDERWEAAGSIVTLGIREAICVPMQGRYGVVGVIYIDTYTPPGRSLQKPIANRFQEDHLKLMVAIGHQAALAIEDTSYYSAMVQAERLAAIGQTIAMLSHHIKNILQGIRGGSYLIEEGLNGEEWDVVQKGWSIVEKNQDKISNLVMDMLSFSKERTPDMVAADLNEVVADVVELMRSRAADAKVELAWTPGSESMPLTFDPDAMHRAILNVVTNAIDACERSEDGGSRVEVSTRLDDERDVAQVIIGDDGEGIEPDDLEKIFSVFESSKGHRGTGLGLSVSQKILMEHDGEIFVESEPGQGARFILELPAIAAE